MATAEGRVDEVKVPGGVDGHGDVRTRRLVRGKRAQRRAVRGGVGDEDVLARAARVQPERLGQRVAHDAPVSWLYQDALDQVPAAQRLAHHPDGQLARSSHQVGSVPVERGEIDHGEGRVEVGGCPVIPVVSARSYHQAAHSGTVTVLLRKRITGA